MLKTMRLTALLQNDPLMCYNKKRAETRIEIWCVDNKSLSASHDELRLAITQGASRAKLEMLRNRMRRYTSITLQSGKEVETIMNVLRYRIEVLSRRVGFQSTVSVPYLREDPVWGYELVYNPVRPKLVNSGVKDYSVCNFDPSRSVLSQMGCFQ